MPSHEFPLGAPAERKLEWGVAGTPLAGESTSGDLYVVQEFPGGVLVAVIDALGHGPEAAQAARLAADTLERHAAEDPQDLLLRCNRVLRGTRGVVMTLASIAWEENTMTWIGVGDVAGVLITNDRPGTAGRLETMLLTRGGIIGAGEEPSARPWVIPLAGGDVVIMATDGIRRDFASRRPAVGAPQEMAEELLDAYQKGTDDALVLVARYPEDGGTAE